jgi:hypothetical protein
MTTNYSTWFSITLKNDFFNSDVFTDCYILPTSDTKQNFFSGLNWLQRFFDNTLYVLISADSNDPNSRKPSINIPADKFFRFYLFTYNSNFFNYTNIDGRIGKGYVLYLSNFASNAIPDPNNSSIKVLNLSAPVKQYSSFASNTVFLPGDLVSDAGIVYECIVQSQNNALTNVDYWLKKDTTQYISSADILPLSSSTYRYVFNDDIIKFTATVRGFQVSGNSLVEYDVFTTGQTFTEAIREIQLDFSALKPGRYKIVLSAIKALTNAAITPDAITLYYDAELKSNKALAVIEIFNCITEGTEYSLQKNIPPNVIAAPVYTINFANRLVLWNYIFKTNDFTGVNSTVAGINFSGSGQTYVSNKPLPFVKRFTYTPFTVSGSSPPKEVPWPSPSVLKYNKESDGSIKNFFTEIYLNY